MRPSRASPPTARPAHARNLDPSSSPLPRPEVLVTVWELAKLDRRGAPTGLLRLEFEAACCLVSLALFENLAALDRRALDARDASEPAREDPRLRKRLRYATRGMYWKFRAFHVTARPNANRGSRGDEHVDAIAPTAIAPTAIAPTSTTTIARTEPSPSARTEPSPSARTEPSPPPRSAPPVPPRPSSVPPRPSFAPPRPSPFAPMSLASTIAWRTPAADAASLFDGFERVSLGEDVTATDSSARTPFAVDDRAGCASWDWDVGENSRPSGGVAFGSMDFSGERFEAHGLNGTPDANANATTVSTSTSTTTARVWQRSREEEEWRSATRTWPWLAAAAGAASTVASDSRVPSGTAGEAREEEREAATNRATPGDWEAFTQSF